MKYNFKNCRVVINAGTEVLKIDGMGAPARETPAHEMAGVNIQRTYEDYSVFMANLDGVKIGDRVKLPRITTPSMKYGGMNFEELDLEEYATVYDMDESNIHLVFDRAIMQSAIDNDYNENKAFKDTPLGQWLNDTLNGAMIDAGIPAADCGLLRKDELWGDNAKPFFKDGRNRVCFDKEEDCSIWYWTETVENASAAYFCAAYHDGDSSCNDASSAGNCVRPRFIILKS